MTVDNREPASVGKAILEYMKLHPKLTASQAYDQLYSQEHNGQSSNGKVAGGVLS